MINMVHGKGLQVSTLNVRTLTATGSTLLDREFTRLNIGIAGLQEFRRLDSGKLSAGSRKFRWSGVPDDSVRQYGVALAITHEMYRYSSMIGWRPVSLFVVVAYRFEDGSRRNNGLRMAGSWFQRKDIYPWNWYSNYRVTGKEIDHVLVGTRWKTMRSCRVKRNLEIGSDHKPVCATLRLHLKRAHARAESGKRFDSDKLDDPAVAAQFVGSIAIRPATPFSGVEEDWSHLKIQCVKLPRMLWALNAVKCGMVSQ